MPKGPRDGNGELANVAAGDLALILAFTMSMMIDDMDVVSEQITVGIVISHNNTLWYVQEKLEAIRQRINKEQFKELGAVLTGREPTNDTLQQKLQSDSFVIVIVPGQSAISTDFHVCIVLNCFDNFFVRTPFRHNVWHSRCKMLNLILCPEPNIPRDKHGNWDFFCDVLRKQNWVNDVREQLERTRANSFALCASSVASHKAFYETCLAPFIEKWSKTEWSMPREEFYGQLRYWIEEGEVTAPQQVFCS